MNTVVRNTGELYEKVHVTIPYDIAKAELGKEVILSSRHPDPDVLAILVADHLSKSGIQCGLEDVQIVYPEFGAEIADYNADLDVLRPDYTFTAMVRRR